MRPSRTGRIMSSSEDMIPCMRCNKLCAPYKVLRFGDDGFVCKKCRKEYNKMRKNVRDKLMEKLEEEQKIMIVLDEIDPQEKRTKLIKMAHDLKQKNWDNTVRSVSNCIKQIGDVLGKIDHYKREVILEWGNMPLLEHDDSGLLQVYDGSVVDTNGIPQRLNADGQFVVWV